ncbi:hypothetical protein Pelo_11182 [Pelomyxa schiedti]|nr:hypothetical protein Pelo_11182 [Pelomyxa schiedti]
MCSTLQTCELRRLFCYTCGSAHDIAAVSVYYKCEGHGASHAPVTPPVHENPPSLVSLCEPLHRPCTCGCPSASLFFRCPTGHNQRLSAGAMRFHVVLAPSSADSASGAHHPSPPMPHAPTAPATAPATAPPTELSPSSSSTPTPTNSAANKAAPPGVAELLSPLFCQDTECEGGLPTGASYCPRFPMRLEVVPFDRVPPCVPSIRLLNGQAIIGHPDFNAMKFRLVNITEVQDGNIEKYEGNLNLALYRKCRDSFVQTNISYLTSTEFRRQPPSNLHVENRGHQLRACEIDTVEALPSMLLAEQLWQRLTGGDTTSMVATLAVLSSCFRRAPVREWLSIDACSIFHNGTVTKQEFLQLCSFWLSEESPPVFSFDPALVGYWKSHSWICGFFEENNYETLFSAFPNCAILHFSGSFAGRYVLKCSPTQEGVSIFRKERDSPFMVAVHKGTPTHVKLHSTPITSASSAELSPVTLSGWYVPVPVGTLPTFFPTLQAVIESIIPSCYGWITREMLQAYMCNKQHLGE